MGIEIDVRDHSKWGREIVKRSLSINKRVVNSASFSVEDYNLIVERSCSRVFRKVSP